MPTVGWRGSLSQFQEITFIKKRFLILKVVLYQLHDAELVFFFFLGTKSIFDLLNTCINNLVEVSSQYQFVYRGGRQKPLKQGRGKSQIESLEKNTFHRCCTPQGNILRNTRYCVGFSPFRSKLHNNGKYCLF